MKSVFTSRRGNRRARSFQRRMAWTGIVTILTLLVSLFPQVAGLPVPTAEAHNLNASVVYVFFDPDTQAMLDARIAGGWTPGTPLLQDASSPLGPDELGIIIKMVPDAGTTTGVGGYTTFYVPDGLQVLDAAFLLPGSDPADGITDWDKVPAKGQARMPAVGAGGGPTVSLVGIARGPNILGTSSPIVTAGNVNLGTLPGVYGDSGIFYSTAPETAFGSYTGAAQSIKNNSGDIVGLRTVLQNPLNAWDAWQMAGYGIAGTTNPTYPAAALVDSNQRGNAPWGLANVVAGPQSGYAWEFNKPVYDGCDSTPTTSPQANCIDLATQTVGPWQRIQYPGSLFADDPPGNNPAVQPYVSGTNASWSGYALSLTTPLPATVSQTDTSSPKAIRWAFGQLTYNRPEYAWIKVKVNDFTQILDETGCPKWTVDTFGGDAGGDSGGKDHMWRYYDPNSVTFNGCLAIGKPATRELVKVGEFFQYKVKLYNAGNNDFSIVQVKDTLPSGATFVSAVPAPSIVSLPNLTWNVSPFKMGQMFEATVTVQAKSGGLITNEVCAVGTTDPGGQTISSCANDTTLVGNLPLLDQSKSVTPENVAPGGQVTYTVRIRNIGTGATGSPVAITELLPAGFTYVGPLVNATMNGANVTATTTVNATNPNRPVFTVPGAIQANNELTLSFTAQVSAALAPGSYCNAYTSSQGGINLTTGSLACVQVAGGKIGDTIWRDWDGDGAQDPEEEGIAGVTVKLYASDGTTLLQTTTTDANGNYYFPGLVSGTYVVEVNNGVALTGTTLTGDPDGTLDNRHTVTLSENQQYLTADFGYQPGGAGAQGDVDNKGGIGDRVFEDVGNDGVFTPGVDTGIAGVTVYLYEDSDGDGIITPGVDALVGTRVTDANGFYSFTFLGEKYDYIVYVDPNDPALLTYFGVDPYQASTINPHPVDYLIGVYLDADFGFWRVAPASIGDQVFIDNNGNGVYDAGDTPLAGVTVTLYRDGEPYKTTVSGPDGTYLFDNLGPGDYRVDVDTSTAPADLGATIRSYSVTLAAGDAFLDADFPFVPFLTKSVSATFVNPGDVITFTLKPFYPGSELLSGVRVMDPLPTDTTYVVGSANAGGSFGAYVPLPAEAGEDLEGGPLGTTALRSSISRTPGFVNVGGTVNVTLRITSSVTINNVAPVDFLVSGGTATCSGPTPPSANLSANVGQNFAWTCTTTGVGEIVFSAGAEDDTEAYGWPTASSASVLSAPDGGPNVVTWNLGSNTARVPSETIISGAPAGIYGLRGDNATNFARYGLTSGAWTDRANYGGGNVGKGGALTTDGVQTIYGLRGNGTQLFYSYDVITNIWTARANTGVNVNEGGALVFLNVGGTDYVYALMGNGTGFRRWAVVTGAGAGSWEARASVPNNVKWGGALTTDGTYIYALRGDGKKDFYRYDPVANSWTAMAPFLQNVKAGGALTYLNGYIYAFRGDDKNEFYRYSVAADSWTRLANAPDKAREGGALTNNGTYIYAFQGKDKTSFWRYNVATDTWIALSSYSYTVFAGGALTYVPAAAINSRLNAMEASPSLVSAGDTVTVRMELDADSPVTNVVPGPVTVTGVNGASATLASGPTLMSPDNNISGAGDPVVYEWSYSVIPGAAPGSLTFSAGASADGGVTFGSATSNSVLVSPLLTFRVTVNNPGPTSGVVRNTGLLAEPPTIGATTSNTTETATAGSIGDYVWADLNGDGVQDPGEFGLAGVKVYVDSNNNGQWDPGEPYDITDAAGLYRIYGLGAGTYTVRADPATYPAGYLPTTASSLSVTLTAGQQYNDADFGLATGTASIGDTVWLDANNNGLLDGTEQGLAGITVLLYADVNGDGSLDAGDTLLATAVTDANGNYLFEGLPPGDYLVVVDETSTVTSPYDGNSYTLAAAMNLVVGSNTQSVTLTAGQAYLDADFPYNWGGAIGDYVWYDTNRNQLADESPATPIEGATVLLYHDANNNGILDPAEYTPIAFMDTDASGQYLFTNLPPGNYLVDVYEDSVAGDDTGGVRNVVPTTPDVRVVTLGPNQTYLDADFGYYVGAWVRGNVFHDDDRNQLFDPSETGLAGLTVTLTGTDKNGNPVFETTTTDANGHFIIIVPEGDYTLTYDTAQTTAAGYPDATTATSFDFYAYPGEDWQDTFDFGVDYSGAIGDRVWNDANGDGVQDAGEPGLAGVTVTLYKDNDNSGTLSAGDTFVAAQATAADGYYLFEGLADGNYIVVVNAFTLPLDFGQTYDNFGGLDGTGKGTVSGGNTVTTVDFGYRYAPAGGASLYTISGRVYNDANNNGDDDDETGFAGVDVTVVCNFGTFIVQTDSNGDWAVAGIAAGSVCTVLDADETDLPRLDYTATEAPTTPITVNGNITGLDFGYYQTPGSISGTVCEGTGNGICDPGEDPIEGVTVTLTWAGPDGILGTPDDQVFTQETDASGDYIFINLQPGLYQIEQANLPGYTSVADADGGNPDVISPVVLPLGGVITDQDFEDTRLGDVTVTKTLLAPLPGPATISDTVKFEIVVKNTGQSLLTTVPLWDYYSPACLENPVVTPEITVYIDNLQPSWTAPGGGGVFSAYVGPPSYNYVSPGATAVYLGRAAGIIKAGLAVDPTSGDYEDEGLFAFRPTVTIDAFAARPVTYDVVNQEGTNPVWMTIEIDTGVAGDRSDNTVYQHVPTSNPAGWHTVNAAAGLWQKWNDNQGNVTGNPLISLSAVAAAHPGLDVVRAYLRLGMGNSYAGSGNGTVGWVDKAILGGVTYDFVVTGGGPGTSTNPTLGVLHWPNLAPAGGLLPGRAVTVTVDFHATIGTTACDPTTNTAKVIGAEDEFGLQLPDEEASAQVRIVEQPGIGLAKAVDDVTNVGDGTYVVTYTLTVSNTGNVPLASVQVTDTLSLTFAGAGGFNVEDVATSPNLTPNAGYTGVSPNISLLAGTDTLGVGASGLITLTVTVTPTTNLGVYENQARATGVSPLGAQVADLSQDGTDVDPDGDGDPTNNNDPTPLTFTEDPVIGLAKEATQVVNNGDGTYVVTFTLTVQNYGDVILHNLVITDAITTQFAGLSPTGFTAITGTLNANPAWNGTAGSNILAAGQSLAVGASGTVQIRFTVTPGSAQTVKNTAHTQGTSPAGTPVTDLSQDGLDPDPIVPPQTQPDGDPTNNNEPTPVTFTENPVIGLAKALQSVDNLGGGQFRVTYLLTVRNYGNVNLYNLQVTDNLATTFTGATSWSVDDLSSADFSVNFPGYTGAPPNTGLLLGTDTLAVGASGTITLKVLVTPGSNLGPYNNQATATGDSPFGAPVSDLSHNGTNPDPDNDGNPTNNNDPTPLSFTAKTQIGVAKAVSQVVNNGDGTYDVTYSILVVNMGDTVLNNVQVTDNLNTTFGAGKHAVQSVSSTTFAVNFPGYTGVTPNTSLLMGTDSLSPGASGSITLVVRVTPGANLGPYDNQARGTASGPGGVPTADNSQNGTNPDPDGDGDPTNNNQLTPVTFTEAPVIGIAKAVASATNNGDGTFTVAYTLTVKNYGDVVLKDVRVTDNLAATFPAPTTFSVVSVTSTGFTVNWPGYNGSSDFNLLAATGNTLAVGQTKTIVLTVTVTPAASPATYNNQATATGVSPAGKQVSDLSTVGIDPDSDGVDPNNDGDGDPTNNSEPTPVTLTQTPAIRVVKTGPTASYVGATAVYTYAVSIPSPGDVRLSSVTVTDNKCASVTPVPATGFNVGDTNTDGYLDPNETWLFTCSYVVQANDLDPLVNVATATGVGPLGQQVSDTDDWRTDLVTFSIGDRVWLDTDGDGIQDPGETVGFYNVPIVITGTDVDGGSVNITVYTDINGNYLATLAKPGDYTVTAPATFGGYAPSTPTTRSVTLTTAAPNYLDADFGYVMPTGLFITGFASVPDMAQMHLTWQAQLPDGSEAPAFQVWRSALNGGWKRLTYTPVAATSYDGTTYYYTYTDIAVERGAVYLYRLEAADGAAYGPWQVEVPGGKYRSFLPHVLR